MAHTCGRKTLVLSKRRDECVCICKILKNTHGIEDVTLLLGGTKAPDLSRSVIVATSSAAGEGFDCPSLNTLILASSQKG